MKLLLSYWAERFGIENRWNGDRADVFGRVFGVEVRARLDVEDAVVHAETNDPGGVMRDTVRVYILRKLQKYLHPTYAEL